MSGETSNSTRISKRFADLRASGELGIVAYITAGDPSLDATLQFVLAVAEAGADVIELGVPFSDPLADGPTIQRASERALKSGTTLAGVLDLVAAFANRARPQTKSLSSYSATTIPSSKWASKILIFRRLRRSRWRSRYGPHARRIRRISQHSLCAPSRHHLSRRANLYRRTPRENRRLLFRLSLSHFAHGRYRNKRCAPRRSPIAPAPRRAVTHLPIAVGFGISLPGHVSVLGGLADAAVIGSALVSEIEKAQSVDSAASALGARIRSLKEAARHGLSRREVAK